MSAPQNLLEPVESKAKAESDSADHRSGRIAPSNKIPDIKRCKITRRIVHRAFFSGHGDKMLLRIKPHLFDPNSDKLFISQRFEGRSRFRDNNDEGLFQIDRIQDAVRIVGIDIRDEMDPASRTPKRLQGDAKSPGSQIRSPDADLDQVGEFSLMLF